MTSGVVDVFRVCLVNEPCGPSCSSPRSRLACKTGCQIVYISSTSESSEASNVRTKPNTRTLNKKFLESNKSKERESERASENCNLLLVRLMVHLSLCVVSKSGASWQDLSYISVPWIISIRRGYLFCHPLVSRLMELTSLPYLGNSADVL